MSDRQPLSTITWEHRRLAREAKTLRAMVELYCRGEHGTKKDALCDECQALVGYAYLRLSQCPFGEQKPTCAKCPIHCYEPEKREQIRTVMRYAGPRMLLHRPVLAVLHLLDGLVRKGR